MSTIQSSVPCWKLTSYLVVLLCIFEDLHIDVDDSHAFGTATEPCEGASIRDTDL